MSDTPGTAAVPPVIALTMEGTCMRKPAFTKRTRTEPVAPAGVVANWDFQLALWSKDTPLIRK